jgi:hypothetical protein
MPLKGSSFLGSAKNFGNPNGTVGMAMMRHGIKPFEVGHDSISKAATLSGFRVWFDGSSGGGHGALLASCVGLWGSVCPSARDPYLRICKSGVTTASRALRTSGFLLSSLCGIYVLHGLSHSHTVFCTPHRHREGRR